MPTTGAVIIHHRNYPTILRTVQAVLSEGISPNRVIVVDNSENADVTEALKQSLQPGVGLVEVPNEGYGAAANIGVQRLLEDHPALDYVLISSHETVPRAGAVSALAEALTGDTSWPWSGLRLFRGTTLPVVPSAGRRVGRSAGV